MSELAARARVLIQRTKGFGAEQYISAIYGSSRQLDPNFPVHCFR